MPQFTPGRWWIAQPMFDGDVIYAPPTEKGRRNDVVAMGILNHADAQLISIAPEMYRLLETFCKIYGMKIQTKADNDKVKFLGALLTEEDTVKKARELLARIDGKENGHD